MVWAQVFDTYKSSECLENFLFHMIPNGFIICAACKDDISTSLSDKCKDWFKNIGSKDIENVLYR